MKYLQLLYLKWIGRACPHICMLCQFKYICFRDINALIEELKCIKELKIYKGLNKL